MTAKGHSAKPEVNWSNIAIALARKICVKFAFPFSAILRAAAIFALPAVDILLSVCRAKSRVAAIALTSLVKRSFSFSKILTTLLRLVSPKKDCCGAKSAVGEGESCKEERALDQ